MKRNGIWLLALVLAMGLIAGGCGDDDDSGDDGGEALTKQQFVTQANAICERGNGELDAAAEETFSKGQPSPEQLEQFASDTLVPNIQGQIDEIRDLGFPEADEDSLTDTFDKAELALQDIKEDPSSLNGSSDPFAEVNKELDAYGLTACGSG